MPSCLEKLLIVRKRCTKVATWFQKLLLLTYLPFPNMCTGMSPNIPHIKYHALLCIASSHGKCTEYKILKYSRSTHGVQRSDLRIRHQMIFISYLTPPVSNPNPTACCPPLSHPIPKRQPRTLHPSPPKLHTTLQPTISYGSTYCSYVQLHLIHSSWGSPNIPPPLHQAFL